ncbi:hypothetical protein N8I77_006517 [Diaporthe amygdali]|uniref:Rhodopsin domain-containing protein n=1 Tax=Phomopsis amygdali TaxID=1214568 RepID=A0AAD9SG24_PHOAM|nr:hypothetical protein N8I77_006517 [Diaporthe amygdali]
MSTSFVPAAPPPPSATPDFDHPRDVHHVINWINTGLCLALVTIFSAVRLYVKLVARRDRFLLEDYAFIAAWAMTALIIIGVLMLTHYGEGYHVWELSQSQYRDFLLWLYICTVVYGPAAFATKVTLLLLIARIFAVKELVSKALRWFMIGLGIVYSGIQIPKVMVCTPISAYWEITAKVGVTGQNPYCLNQSHIFIADISVAVLTDFIILIVPIPLALSMNCLSFKQKVQIILLLSAGGAAVTQATTQSASKCATDIEVLI